MNAIRYPLILFNTMIIILEFICGNQYHAFMGTKVILYKNVK